MTTVAERLQRIRQIDDAAQKGREFEKLFATVARQAPELAVKHIYQMGEWPAAASHGLDGQDIGVDRVAVLHSGEVVAVQCKCYDESRKVQKSDVQNFLAGSQNQAFDMRWLVTTSDLTDNVRKMLANTNIKHIDFHQFSAHELQQQRREPRQPLPLQQQAIDAVIEGFGNPKSSGRGQLIMACGTGKTFTSLRIAEQLVADGGRILFLAPSIALVAQARREWLAHTKRPLKCTVVCSDTTVGGGGESISLQELSFSVTTDPARIARDLQQSPDDGAHLVFCTYHSLPKVMEAQQQGTTEFDLAIVDEAHRTTGIQRDDDERRNFQLIHDQANIKCQRRLYMTATPRIYTEKAKDQRKAKHPGITITDMGDSHVYGPRFHRISFMEAVAADMLCDVRVICLGLSDDMLEQEIKEELESISNQISGHGKPPDVQEYMSALVIGLALNGWIQGKRVELPEKLPRTLAYANTIRRSKWLAKVLESEVIQDFLRRYRESRSRALQRQAVGDIKAEHLDASSSAHQRNLAISKLNTAGRDGNLRIIANCRLFSEGIDVPSLNSVAFLDPKSSTSDIIQSIGRVMRKGGDDKRLGYIIAPFSLPSDKSVAEALEERSPRFAILGRVLQALQAHDETLYSKLSNVALDYEKYEPDDEPGEPGTELQDDGPEDEPEALIPEDLDDLKSIYAQLANYSGLGNRGTLVADIIIAAVKRAARVFKNEKVDESLAILLGTTGELLASLSEKDRQAKLQDAAHTAALIICNACLMHKRLEATDNLDGLQPLEKMGSKADVIGILVQDWRAILQKDYKPIFAQALAIMEHLQAKHSDKVNLQTAMHTLINCAADTSEALNELGYDHAGPLYHRILDNAATQGAFYTKNLSALLMGKLVFNDQMTDWANPQKVQALRIIDPCCGTGTLLMAALNAIKQKAAQAQDMTDEQKQALHKHLVENSIHGLDITSQAVQLAACNLTLGAPKTSYERMNLYTLEYGMAHGQSTPHPQNVRQGALELLNQMDFADAGKAQPLALQELTAPVSATGVSSDESEDLSVSSEFDVLVVNPPFTETPKQKGQFPKAVGNAMSKRLGQIATLLQKRSPEAHRSLAKRSIAPFFTPLAHSLVSESGTFAQFIPSTFCTANNAKEQRRYIAKRFHIETVVTSHDPKNIAFSASTNIHESLMIARRAGVEAPPPTRFIQLAQMPTDAKEVEEMVQAINSGNLGDWGSCIQYPADKIQQGDWSPVQWYAPQLVEAVVQIDGLARLDTKPQYGWRQEDSKFRTTFDYKSGVRNNRNEANSYCSIAEELHTTMASPQDTWADPKAKKRRVAESLLARGGHILLPCRLSTTSARLIAIYSETPAIGSAFRPIDTALAIPPDLAKAYTVFLNSTFGALQMLNRRTKKLTYPAYETGHMKTLRLPSASLDLQPLTALFDTIRTAELKRLCHAHQDPIRQQLDHAVAALLDIDPATTDQWRTLLAHEPTISNKPAQPNPPPSS